MHGFKAMKALNRVASANELAAPDAVVLAAVSPNAGRRVVVASSDAALRARLCTSLSAMRWEVLEAGGGAAAFVHLDGHPQDALLLDNWLPDLEVGEFARTLSGMYPGVDVLRVDGSPVVGEARSPRRHELLHALREAQSEAYMEVLSDGLPLVQRADGAAFLSAAAAVPRPGMSLAGAGIVVPLVATVPHGYQSRKALKIDGMVGESPGMLELARLIRLVAPRSSTVLIEGETGSGKEIVAQAVHRLSTRAKKLIVVLNCAAIPEALLEAELFGHSRGAFTGATQARTGRIEAAHGGTLFLDEIGEMPLPLQAKMLRFLECGELQRVGENAIVRVDVRVIAATHQLLEEQAAEGGFRLDLYHRLAVFPIEVPPLRQRKEDIALLARHFLAKLGIDAPRKQLSEAALERLYVHDWPGNVRELAHVLERATILAGDAQVLVPEHIRLKVARNVVVPIALGVTKKAPSPPMRKR